MAESNDISDEEKNTRFYEHSCHRLKLLEGLNSLRQQGLLLDVTLIVEGTTFKAHKAVLSACSDYFRAMFTDNMLEATKNEITLGGITSRGFKELLIYAYTGRLVLDLENIQDVLAAASLVQMEDCTTACANYLEGQMDLENCVDIAKIAETYSLHALTIQAYQYMNANLLQFSKSKEFYKLTPVQIESLLVQDFPVDCSEADVLRIFLTWLFHVDYFELDVRVRHAVRVIQHIHFVEISYKKLMSILDKFFQDRKYPWQILKRYIIINYRLQACEDLPRAVAKPLLNSRGMEEAILKIGGIGLSGVTNDITYCFPSSPKWKLLTSIPHVDQCNYGAVVFRNQLYIVGGCYNQFMQENIHPFGFKFCPRSGQWTKISPMKMERCRFSLNEVGGLLYAIGGVHEDVYFFLENSDCECYDPVKNIWINIKPLPICVSQHAGVGLDDEKLYISGGLDKDNDSISNVFCYDVNEKEWRTCAPLLKPRADHVMLAKGPRLYVCGGWTLEGNNRVLVDTIESYCPHRDEWMVITEIPTPRYHAGIVLRDNSIYVIGGFKGNFVDKYISNIEIYDLITHRWTVERGYPQEMWEHTCLTMFIPKSVKSLNAKTKKGG